MGRFRLVVRRREADIDRLRALIGLAPVALDRWLRAALGPLPFDAAPWVALLALGLAVAPLLSAGAEKEVQTVSSSDMVERLVPDSVTYVTLPGLAMPVILPGPGHGTAPPYGILVRDAVDSDELTIVTTDRSPTALQSRYVVGRLIHDDMSDVVSALEDAGGVTTGIDSGLVIIEVPPGDEPIRDVASVADLADVGDQTIVRMPVAFTDDAVPTCELAADGCGGRILAKGGGVFVHLARDIPDASPILVQTTYPSSVVPGSWTGTQLRNQPELEAWASSVPVQRMAGWGRILVLVSVVDDPTILRDRRWLGPVVLGLVALVLWLGLRAGYPVFRAMVEGSRGWRLLRAPDTERPSVPGPVPVRVSGHGTTVEGRRLYLDETPASLEPLASSGLAAGRATASIRLARGGEIVLAAEDIGALGSIERGEMVYLRGVRPALWVRWFGTSLRMTFDSSAERDMAARMIGA